MERRQRVTISEVAKQAGVSKTTISRYLNGKFGFMSEESRQRIAAVIEELDYRPNNLARSLKSCKSRLLGVIIADITSPFSAILVKGITDCSKDYGYHVMIATTDNNPEKEQEYILSMLDQRVEGLIVNTTCKNNAFLLEVAKQYVPIILADRPTFPTLFDTVRTTDYTSTLELMAGLKARQYEKVAFFSEPLNEVGTRILRLQAYEQACREILHQEPWKAIVAMEDEALIEQEILAFLAGAEGKKAIFTPNGVALLQVLKAMKRLDLSVPAAAGVCGFDNWDWAELVGPGITAIDQPSYDVGAACVKRMMFRLQNDRKAPPKIMELPNRIIFRGSTE
ncbi:MAG: LacI family DNA-binding transcriptional regulator [Sporomusaceae bacterium]|nr:LacI family DNA-binding transcriptional regulator [Sporomusaceae bacterium]